MGVYETRATKGQAVVPYQSVPAARQKRALEFLKQELWSNPDWLMPEAIVSRFSTDGVLERVSRIQNRTLKRLLSRSRLNDMNSTSETLPSADLNSSFKVDQLLEELGNDLMDLEASHALNRNLQINWINQLMELSTDEQLSPSVASLVSEAMKQSKARAKSNRRKGSNIERAHYQYAFELLSKDD